MFVTYRERAIVEGTMFNIIPINDLKEHIENSICECKPKIIYENGEMIIIHNSFDNREYYEHIMIKEIKDDWHFEVNIN